jgi:hypothetical protein
MSLRSFETYVKTNNERLEELLKETELAKDAITQEALSRKNFSLAVEKDTKANEAKRWMGGSILGITALLVILFSPIIYKNAPLTLSDILFRITFATPLSIFALFQSKVYKRETGLRDHFHHKGISLASYSGFMSRIERDEGIDSSKKLKLLEDTFEQVLDNPADKLNNLEIKRLKINNQSLTDSIKLIQKFAFPKEFQKFIYNKTEAKKENNTEENSEKVKDDA